MPMTAKNLYAESVQACIGQLSAQDWQAVSSCVKKALAVCD